MSQASGNCRSCGNCGVPFTLQQKISGECARCGTIATRFEVSPDNTSSSLIHDSICGDHSANGNADTPDVESHWSFAQYNRSRRNRGHLAGSRRSPIFVAIGYTLAFTVFTAAFWILLMSGILRLLVVCACVPLLFRRRRRMRAQTKLWEVRRQRRIRLWR